MISLVITSAVNMEITIPSASVWANPLTVPDPFSPRTSAAINVVTLPSTIADSAFLNPTSIAERTVFPDAISSLIRAKMITFASTAETSPLYFFYVYRVLPAAGV